MKSKEEANAEILSDVNEDFSGRPEIRINNRDLDNVHPIDCACPIHEKTMGRREQTLESDTKEKNRLEYPI